MDDFLRGALKDSGVNLTRNNRFPMDEERLTRFRTQLVYLASAVGGGPYRYEGKSMKAALKEMGITDAEFDELLKHLRLALTANGVKPADVMIILETIPTIRGDIVAPPVVAPNQEPHRILSLWDRLGGEPKVGKIVNDFVDIAVKDARVNFSRGNKFKMGPQQVAQLKRQFLLLASQVSGGPYKYEGRSMKEIHFGMRITDAEFDALLSDLRIVLNHNQVGQVEFALLIKAVELTRKDIVEGAGMAAPALAPPRVPANPTAPRPAPTNGERSAADSTDGREPARLIRSLTETTMSGGSPLGSLIQWTIAQAGGENSASKPRARGDHVP
jgi:hemoglobin